MKNVYFKTLWNKPSNFKYTTKATKLNTTGQYEKYNYYKHSHTYILNEQLH